MGSIDRMCVVTLIAGSILVAGPARADEHAAKPEVPNGHVVWFDLTTTDMAKSKAFYGALLGWTFAGLGGTEYAVEIEADGVPVGTLRVAEGPITAFDGVVYIQVPDVGEISRRATELGGTVPPGFPFDLDDKPGAITVIVDPVGHPIGMYSRTKLAPATGAKE